MGGTIGSGTFGIVFKAMDGNTPVALKKIKMEREIQGFPVTAIREIKILKALRHVNIVDMREIVVYNEADDKESVGGSSEFVNGDVFMVFEYVDYDLSGILKSSDVVLTPAHVKSFTKQLLEGTHYLHKNNILHRDIKAANILITKDNVLKIADWGLARYYQEGNTRMTNPVVTLWYRSPELLCGSHKYGPEVDIWSVGCLFAEMFTRNPIFAIKDSPDSLVRQLEQLYQQCGTPTGDLLKKYEAYPDWEKCKFTVRSNNRIRYRFSNDAQWSERSLSLLEQLLDFDPDARITADTALHHEYFYETEIVRPEQLPRFDTVETARGMDVAVKQRADYEQAIEAKRVAEEKKRQEEAALAASMKAEQRQRSRNSTGGGAGGGRRGAGLSGASKYKVVRPNHHQQQQQQQQQQPVVPVAVAVAAAPVPAAVPVPVPTSHNNRSIGTTGSAGAGARAPAPPSSSLSFTAPAVPTLLVAAADAHAAVKGSSSSMGVTGAAGASASGSGEAAVSTIKVTSLSNSGGGAGSSGGGW
jgi:serine/threonine protein kinase